MELAGIAVTDAVVSSFVQTVSLNDVSDAFGDGKTEALFNREDDIAAEDDVLASVDSLGVFVASDADT